MSHNYRIDAIIILIAINSDMKIEFRGVAPYIKVNVYVL